jgi:hypothetical protein
MTLTVETRVTQWVCKLHNSGLQAQSLRLAWASTEDSAYKVYSGATVNNERLQISSGDRPRAD